MKSFSFRGRKMTAAAAVETTLKTSRRRRNALVKRKWWSCQSAGGRAQAKGERKKKKNEEPARVWRCAVASATYHLDPGNGLCCLGVVHRLKVVGFGSDQSVCFERRTLTMLLGAEVRNKIGGNVEWSVCARVV
jgi:hypothetical protein